MLMLRGEEVRELLAGREQEIVEAVSRAYVAHTRRQTSMPHSAFLRFPESSNRMIALPAYLGGESRLAGVKWVSSFPANVEAGGNRASAVIVLNSLEDGFAEAVLEGSVISALRTAAGAVLAAGRLRPNAVGSAGLVGCGLINYEVLRFLVAARPGLEMVQVFDLDLRRAEEFASRAAADFAGLRVTLAAKVEAILERHPVISLATTAGSPHVHDMSICDPSAVVLHVSLRDISPHAILACDNVVDDADHVCQAQTSLHLAEQLAGHRRFIRCSLGEILAGHAPAASGSRAVTVFSPFGLGILDLAVARLAQEAAHAAGRGLVIEDFHPRPWRLARVS